MPPVGQEVRRQMFSFLLRFIQLRDRRRLSACGEHAMDDARHPKTGSRRRCSTCPPAMGVGVSQTI